MAGFLGSHVAEWALSQNYEVRGCDNLSLGSPDNIPEGVEFYEYDCLDLEKNKKFTKGADLIFHAAAYPYDNFSLRSPLKAAETVFSSTASILSAGISNGLRRFVHCSSMSRYGDNKTPYTEDMPARALTPYGVAKAASEDLLKSLSQVYPFEYVILIPHNIFGPRQVYNDPHRNAVSLITHQILSKQAPLIYGDGKQRRGFSPIQDLIPLFQEILFGEKVKNQTINIGPDEESISLNELVQLLAEITGQKIQPKYIPLRPLEIKTALCSAEKSRKLLNYRQQISLKEGLKVLVEWIESQGFSKLIERQRAEIESPPEKGTE